MGRPSPDAQAVERHDAAARMRRTRARRALGLASYRIEVDAVGIEELLISEGCLAAWDADNPRSVEAALSTYLANCVARNAAAESEGLERSA